jgi:hypothetical protein
VAFPDPQAELEQLVRLEPQVWLAPQVPQDELAARVQQVCQEQVEQLVPLVPLVLPVQLGELVLLVPLVLPVQEGFKDLLAPLAKQGLLVHQELQVSVEGLEQLEPVVLLDPLAGLVVLALLDLKVQLVP